MSLTPEDVVNKSFSPTKFREGYDQDEVDDFLDEVVLELRRLGQENEELRQRLISSEARASAGGAAPSSSSAPVSFEGGFAMPGDQGNSSNLLQLARRLHEEHVREGMEKRDQLIAEGQAAVQQALAEAQATAQRAVADAEAQVRSHNSALEQERVMLERRVSELRGFEREYRSRLKNYIEGQLRELDLASIMAPLQGQPMPQHQGIPQQQAAPGHYLPPQGMPAQGVPQQTAPAQGMPAQPMPQPQPQPQANPYQQPMPGYTPGAMPQIPQAPLPQAPQPTGYQNFGGQ